jgi:nicotinamidase/pyrazinamidase
VRYSAIDSMRAGFETYVIEDACRAIDVGNSVADTNYDFNEAGARRITSAMLGSP